ncbi:hypothetical protein EI94DRAFT_1704815 [Lactarius quietus]|nr:hypothetical protein EI94DRAFT_1704815 [Lactarius quietus]
MTVSRDPHPSCNDLPASIWGSTASYQVTHKLADSARLIIGEVAVVFCRYECAYGLFFFDVCLITCFPGSYPPRDGADNSKEELGIVLSNDLGSRCEKNVGSPLAPAMKGVQSDKHT